MTPAALRRLSTLGAAGTPPVASATRQPAATQGAAFGSLLTAPEGDSSRVLAAPELLPVPYTQRLQLPAMLAGTAGEGEASSEGAATTVAPGSGAVTAGADDEAGDGMENLTQQVGWEGGQMVSQTLCCVVIAKGYFCSHSAISGAATKQSAAALPTHAPHSRRPPPCALVATCACWRCGACCAPPLQ